MSFFGSFMAAIRNLFGSHDDRQDALMEPLKRLFRQSDNHQGRAKLCH